METVDLLKELVRIPSVSRHHSDISEFIASQVDGTIQEFPVTGHPNGRNVIAISEPHPGKPFILLNGHHDTVAPTEGWETDPFIPQEMDGRLYGLGTNDMKAGLAVIISLFRELKEKHNIIFTSADDEESDSMGSFALLDPNTGPIAHLADRISGVLVAEPTGGRVMLGARGRYALKLTVHGTACHGARPHLGNNAIDRAADISLALRDLPIDSHPQLGNGSCCILKISGGTETLSVPDQCGMVIDRHITARRTGEEVIDEFRRHLSGADPAIDAGIDISLIDREVPFLEPYACSPDEPFVKGFLESLEDQLTNIPEIIYGASVGDYNIFGNRFPTIVYGPSGRFHHSANEYVEIGSVLDAYEKMRYWFSTLE